MKKIFTLFLLCVMAMTAAAESTVKTFTSTLKVTVDGLETSQETTVSVEMLEDNLINFVLPNFALGTGGDALPVGNIEINNLYLRDKGAYSSFNYNANLQIKEGSDPTVSEWFGPTLGNLPLALTGKMSDTELFVNIDLNLLESLGQIVNVQFGSDFAPSKVTGEKTFTANCTTGMIVAGETMDLEPVTGYAAKATFYDNKTMSLDLKNIIFAMGDDLMPLGSAYVSDIDLDDNGSFKTFHHLVRTTLQAGDNGDFWIGANMSVEVELIGKLTDNALYYRLLIGGNDDLNGVLFVNFGTDPAPATPAGAAKVYNDQLVVTVNGESTPAIPASVEVTPLTSGGINFTLKNFVMIGEGIEINVGNINIEDLTLVEGPGYKTFNYTGNIFITPGDAAGVAETDWLGPMLGQIPLRMRGRITDDKLYVTIDIDMVELQQVVFVTFGEPIAADPTVVGLGSIATESAAQTIYDLQGRRVRNASGLHIVNGKTVIR